MAGIAKNKAENITWLLGVGELNLFRQKAKEFGVVILKEGKVVGDRPVRVRIRKPVEAATYSDFALSVRPHHKSDL